MEMPRQRLPLSKKTKEWREDCVKALIDKSSFSSSITNRRDLWKLYDAYHGKINEADYSYVVNPYGTKDKKFLNFPARLRNYNIIQPIIDLRMGEKTKRPMDWMVVAKGADTESRLQEEIKNAIVQNLRQEFVNALNEEGVQTGMETRETQDPKQVAEHVQSTWKDMRVVMGQDAIDYIIQNTDMDDKAMMMYFDWLVSGMSYAYRGIENGEVIYEHISPFDIDFDLPKGKQFVEDAKWITVRRWMSNNDILDRFYDLLSDENIDDLENPQQSGEGFSLGTGWLNSVYGHNYDNNIAERESQIEVIHVCWKSFKKIGFLTYYDDLGQEQTMMVDENYRPDRTVGETVEWKWVNEWWNGWRINGNIFVGIEPLEVQHRSMTNYSECKPPYNGRVWTSLVEAGINYQLLYNIFHYRLELTVAKNKDKIMLMEINMIPKRHGWTEDKFMYFADAAGFAFVDSTGEGKNRERTNFNQWQVMDMSLGKYIEAQFMMLQAIKEEWEERAGVTRPRKGQIMASDSVGVNERSVFQAALITEESDRRFEKMQERDMRALLENSKYAWNDNKKETFIARDGRTVMMSLTPEYKETEYGIFIKNAGKEKEKLDTIRNLSLAFAQNDTSPADIAEILDATSFARLKMHLAKVDAAKKAFEQQQMQMQQEQAEADRQARAAEMEQQMTYQQQLEDNKQQNAVELKQMDIDIEREKMEHDAQIEREKMSSNERIANMSSKE